MFKKWIVLTVVIMVVCWLFDSIHINSIWTGLAMSISMGVTGFLFDELIFLLSIPFIIVTAGIFLIFFNTVMFYVAAFFVPGITIGSFWAAFFASTLISIFYKIGMALTMEKINQITIIKISRRR